MQRLHFVGSSGHDANGLNDEDEVVPSFSTREDLEIYCERLEEQPTQQRDTVINGPLFLIIYMCVHFYITLGEVLQLSLWFQERPKSDQRYSWPPHDG